MLLRDYLDSIDSNANRFAEVIGVASKTVYRWCAGEDVPGREHMAKIHEVTGGQVCANDFYGMGSRDDEPAAEPSPEHI